MIWANLLPSRWFCAKKTPVRRQSKRTPLTIEQLEDRLVPATTTSSLYPAWAQETFSINDAKVAAVNVPVGPMGMASVPTNASFGSMIGLPSVFANTPYRGQGESVAVIDTGIDYMDPALGGGFGPGYKVVAGYNFVNNTANPMDDNGHGTVVAGEIAADDGTYSGVAPDADLIALKVLDSTGSGTFANVQRALDWVVANRVKYNIVAINMSLGSGSYTINPYTFLDSDLSALVSSGVFISVAAGNSFYTNNSVPGLDYPAIDPNVVSVGAVYDGNYGSVAWASGARDYVTAPDLIASFSQRSSALSILAPGAMVTSTYLNDTFESMAGTSMAAPVITGAAVLIDQALLADHLTANQSTILGIMQKTGVSIVDDAVGDANVTPTGLTFQRINLAAALSSLGTPGNVTGPPVLQPIANQTVAPGAKLTVGLSATASNGDAIQFAASVVNSPASLAYQLKQTLGLTYLGSYYTNVWGDNEKWMSSTVGTWYCILPTGLVYRWAGSMSATIQPANLIATLSTSYYADPSLLWNAQPAVIPTVSVANGQLTIQAPAGSAGSYQIEVTASDGALSANQTFTLTVQAGVTPPANPGPPANTGPQIATITNLSMLTLRSQTITLAATDAQNKPITFSAALVGTFATLPATLVVSGKQLTIYTSPDFTGSLNVQVTASDGTLSSTTTFQINVTASAVADRFTGDFNGDGIQDTAFFNQDGSWWVCLKNANGTFVNQNWANWSAASGWASVQVGNFNGDGKTDILGVTTAGAVWVGTSTGTSFTTAFWTQWAPAAAWASITVGDVNGDGKTDLIGQYATGKWYIGYSTGTSFNTQLWTGAAAPASLAKKS